MESLQTVSLDRLKESPLNPRTHFDDKKLAELADSIRGVGIIEPIVARPYKKNGSLPSSEDRFEIIAGSRRFRAAKLAELADVPVIVRDIDDTKALELMVIENNQREDVNALEEAEGYSRLLKTGKEYKLELLAQKIGRSTKYVYDRLKLLELIPEARTIMLGGLMTAGHAILLARLKPDDQKRAIATPGVDYYRGRGLWQHQGGLSFEEEDGAADDAERSKDPHKRYRGFKAVSVRELGAWIDDHVRFDESAHIDPMLFPETAATLAEAAAPAVRAKGDKKIKIVKITENMQTPDDAKKGLDGHIFHASSWKPIGAKPCDVSVIGVKVIGEHRGDALKVCLSRSKCPVHWGAEIKERARYQRAQAQAGSSGPASAPKKETEAAKEKRLAEEAKQKAAEQREAQLEAAFEKAEPKIREALAERFKKAPLSVLKDVIDGFLDDWCTELNIEEYRRAVKLMGTPRNVEDLGRVLVLTMYFTNSMDNGQAADEFCDTVKKDIGLDLAPIVAEFMPKEKPQTSGKGTAAVDSKKTTKAPKKKKK